ncbi:MAG: methionine--tRNA ligase [Patescibacteria group bacterium]
MTKLKRYYITTPIYYVNDKPHIGHAYTTIAGDILARYYKSQGASVFYLTGTDEHGSKVAESADKASMSPQEFADQQAELFKAAWSNLNIKYDYFIRTTDKRHRESVTKFMQQLQDNQAVYEGKYQGLYCTGCEKFFTEKELVDGLCPYHKEPPKQITEKNYFFKLKDHLEEIKKLIESDQVNIRPLAQKNETLGLFKQGLEDFSISREKVKWGIPLPFDQAQNVYVWVDALQNYISAIGYGDNEEEFKKWWQEAEVIHLMARDILKFHAIFWPAMLLANGIKTPDRQYIHGFFSINGQKMSKSLGNIIDPNEMVQEFGTDATRYLLLSQFPFGADGNIDQSNFIAKYNTDLANGLGNLVARTLNMIEKFSEGQIPETVESTRDFAKVNKYTEELAFDKALSEIWSQIAWANIEIDKQKPWDLAKAGQKEKLNKILSQLATLLCEIGQAISPFMPETGNKILKQISAKKIEKGESLFARK